MKLRPYLLLTFFLLSVANASVYTIGTFNVENLFSPTHLKIGHKDWGKIYFDRKIKLVSLVIQHWIPKNKGLLALVEIENAQVLERITSEMGWGHFLVTHGDDRRGINVGLIYGANWKLESFQEIHLDCSFKTRNILEGHFKVENKFPVTVFVNHWPSQMVRDDSGRECAYRALLGRINILKKNEPSTPIMAIGDFNLIKDLPSDFPLIDIKGGAGSYYYARKNQWNFFDRIYLDPLFYASKNYRVDPVSFTVFKDPIMVKRKIKKESDKIGASFIEMKIPKPFYWGKRTIGHGVSDHFPVSVKISIGNFF